MAHRIQHTFAALQFANFRIFFIGMLVSIIGSQMQIVGVGWQLYELTHSAASLGLIGLVGFFPIFFFSLFGGILVDAFDRKKLILVTQLILGIATLIFALLSFFHLVSPLVMYIIIFINGLVTAIDLPARQTLLAHIVPKEYMINAMNLNTLARQIAVLVGPLIAGVSIAAVGVSYLYLFNALSFFFFFIVILFVKGSFRSLTKTPQLTIPAIKEGLHFIWQSPMILSGMLLDFFANFFAAATVIFPIFAKDVLHVGPQGLGLLYAAPSIGAVIAGVSIGGFKVIHYQGKILLASVVVYGFATIGFGISHNLWFSLCCLAVVGGMDMVSMVIRRTISQLLTPDHLRGRMNSIAQMFFIGGPFLGEAEAGFVASLIGAPLSVVLGGLGAILAVIGIAKKVPTVLQYNHE